MPSITITNPTTAVTDPAPIVAPPLTIEGNGDVGVQTPIWTNDSNVAQQLNWSVSNPQNCSYVSTGVDTGNVNYVAADSGSVTVQPGQSVKLNFFFNVPAGEPGVTNPDATADYTAVWA